MRNPVVSAKADRALSNAQKALSELLVYGGTSVDRKLASELWDEIEKMRHRIRKAR